ncbi:MAG TPA: hypothetical protein PLX02_14915 [Syntrophorhabdaceae bacterium]|nr:hypothetical protein [Syntrophorhabdaceae bacterium]HQM82896.1 hypothetical protein [Syntrophorhabdaceae bacterium]
MPLTFDSLSHGEVAFGFFNIETDMLLLEDHFFFARDFCRCIIDIAAETPDKKTATLDGYILEHSVIGNLMGAIAGVELWGFIGDIYSRFPFPHRQENFKQNPEGYKTRDIVETAVRRYSAPSILPVVVETPSGVAGISGYLFSKQQLHKLLDYVWAGGYPRWKDEVRPPYVMEMKEKIKSSLHPVFQGIVLGSN